MKIFQTIKTSTPGTALETIPGLEVPALPEKIAKIDQAGSNDFQAKLGESFMKFREALILALRDPTSLGLGGDTKAAAGLPSLIPISLIQESSTLKVMTSSERNKLAGIETGAQVNTVTSVQGRIGSVVVNASDVGLGDVDNTSDMNKPVSTAQATAINARLPKLTYVGVSMNGASLTASVGKMYGIYATGVTITLPSATSIGDGEVIGFVIGVNASRTLQINTTANQDLVTPDGVKTTGYAVTGFARTVYAVCYFHTWMLCGLEDSAIDDAIAPLAPLASPALTGNPTAPTAAPGTNTTQLATTAFVTGAVAGVTASSIGLGSVNNTADSAKPVSTAQAAAIAACRPKHTYVGISGSPAAIAAERGNTYGINAHGCTLTLPDVTTSGYVDGDEICVLLGVTLPRTLTITSPSWIVRGSGRQPENTPFTLTGRGTFISFTRCDNQWSMSYPEYALDGKAPLASPALTGTPTAPTAAAGTDTTQIATTEFVQDAIGLKQDASNALTTDTTQVVTGEKTFRSASRYYGPGENTNHDALVFGVGSTRFWRARQYTSGSLNVSGNTTDGWQNALGFEFKNDIPYVRLWGTPTAPTAAVGTNNTQLATTAFVQAAVAGALLLTEGTPSGPTEELLTGGTLIEPTEAETNTTQLDTDAFVQAQKASPALTGTPTAPTAAVGTSNTRIATTGFVQSGVKQSVPTTKVLTVTADDTVFLETEALDFSVFNKPVEVSFGCRCVGSVNLDLTVELYNPITSTSITLYTEASVPTNPLSIKSTIVKNVGNFDVLTTRLNDGASAVVLPFNAAVSSASYKIRCICSVGSGGGTVSLFAPEVIITR